MDEFNPFIEPLDINGHLLETGPFSLYAEVWAAKNFESFETYVDLVMNGESVAIYSGIYTLLKDRNVTYAKFVKALLKLDDPKNVLQKLGNHLAYLIKSAQPIIKNPERLKEIKKALGKEEGDHDFEENYAVYFDKIARRYGYSIDTYFSQTSRQLHACFKAMEEEDYKDLELRAALAGRKLKERIKYRDVSPEQEAQEVDQAQAAIERHKARVAKEKAKNGS